MQFFKKNKKLLVCYYYYYYCNVRLRELLQINEYV
ncbi:MAG: hypothetical protein KatS3mg033_0208 [Thermonema sp.]|nr:MAG: hypothetical protein KatS3mg033_0208 [Thermonema sp.]